MTDRAGIIHRVALTGAGGVLGRHMQSRLAQAGIEVVAVGRKDWDLRQWKSPEQLDEVFGRVDAVIHFGAVTPNPGQKLTPDVLMDANVRACAALGQWAALRGIPMVFAGSAGIYAPQAAPADEDAPQADCPVGGFYGLTKLLAERLLVGLTADGLALCTLRITSVYGAGLHPDKMIAKMLAAARRGETIALSAPVDDALNLVHADDVARAALMALRAGARGPFNIGSASLVTVADIAHAAVSVAGNGGVALPDGMASRPPECRFNVSLDRAARTFGFRPALSLAQGLTLMENDRHVL